MAEGGGISYALNALLDSLGLDEDQRQKRMRSRKMYQLLGSWYHESVRGFCSPLQLSGSWYHASVPGTGSILLSGSSYDTTTIEGLSSDVDIVVIPNNIRIIEDIKDWRSDDVMTYMMDSTDCYKSFVRLYLMSSIYPIPAYTYMSSDAHHQADKSGRIIRTNAHILSEFGSYCSLEQHGPALTEPERVGHQEYDLVLALRCKSFPRDAFGWKTRQTQLTRTRIRPAIIDEINHCYLVGVGNKASATPHLEWRLSFSHIENELVHNWNNTQYKCYVMVKFIQKDLIKPHVADALCSYHFKTIMMWMNEEYPSEFFVEANFEQCLLSLLNNLAEAVRRKSLPHYFVDGCNLFYPKITSNQDLAEKLSKTIRDIISSWPYCLSNITRCSLGNMIIEYHLQPTSLAQNCTRVHQKRRRRCFDYELIHEYDELVQIVETALNEIHKSDNHWKDKLFLLSDLLHRSSPTLNDNDNRNTINSKQFIDIVIKDALCSIGLELTQQSRLMTNKNALKNLTLGMCLKQRYFHSCVIDTHLKVAADFVTTGSYERALMSLDKVENQIKPYTEFGCFHRGCLQYIKPAIKDAVYDNKPSLAEFYMNYNACPVIYNQKQMTHVPKGLVYEMFRTTAVSPVSDPRRYNWYLQAVIHCPVYLHYLRFLCYQRQGQDAHRQAAMDNMNWAAREIAYSPRIHEDTNHNVIGHCHRSVGDTRRAYKEYRKSLRKEKYNNAVLWHLAVLLRGKIRGD